MPNGTALGLGFGSDVCHILVFLYKPAAKSGYEPILGALSKGPMSGYDIHKMYAEALAFFWQEGFGQIYPALKALEAAGLIERVPGQTAKPSGVSTRKRTVYRQTGEGKRAFSLWLREASTVRPARNEVLLKLFFAGSDTEAAMAQVSQYAADSRGKVERLTAIRSVVKDRAPLLDLLVLQHGLDTAEAALRWAENATIALERVASLASKPKVGGAFVPGDKSRRRPRLTQ